MAIAQGRNDIQVEHDIVLHGFIDQIEVAHKSQTEQEDSVKAKLYDILVDNSIGQEERRSLELPLYGVLEDITEKHNRIRSAILIGMYSFWEVSLSAMNEVITSLNTNESKEYKIKKATKKRCSKAFIYLNSIYGDTIPKGCLLIDGPIRVLRNFLVHGNLYDDQKYVLREFCKTQTEFSIKESCGDFVITTYNGLINLLNIISHELSKAEQRISIMKK